MQTIDQERQVLLGVLLVEASELLRAATDNSFEVAWDYRPLIRPHALKQDTEWVDECSLET